MSKRFFSFVIVFVIIATTMTACSTNKSNNAPVDFAPTTEVVEVKSIYSSELSALALGFIESENKSSLEGAIIATAANFGLKETIIANAKTAIAETGLNENVHYIECSIHNYDLGGYVGVMKLNPDKAVYNYNHRPLYLAASLLYEEEINADKIISAYVLSLMDADTPENLADLLIVTDSDDDKQYNLSISQNADFREKAREILLSSLG